VRPGSLGVGWRIKTLEGELTLWGRALVCRKNTFLLIGPGLVEEIDQEPLGRQI